MKAIYAACCCSVTVLLAHAQLHEHCEASFGEPQRSSQVEGLCAGAADAAAGTSGRRQDNAAQGACREAAARSRASGVIPISLFSSWHNWHGQSRSGNKGVIRPCRSFSFMFPGRVLQCFTAQQGLLFVAWGYVLDAFNYMNPSSSNVKGNAIL